MPDQEKEKTPTAVEPAETHAAASPAPPPAKTAAVTEEATSQYFFGEPLVPRRG